MPPPTTELAGSENHNVQICDHSSTFIFDWIFFILADNEDKHKAWMSLNFAQVSFRTVEKAALECVD